MSTNVDDKFPLIMNLLKLHYKASLVTIEINDNGNFQFIYQFIKPSDEVQTRRFLNLYLFEELSELIETYSKDKEEREFAFKELFELVLLIGK